MRKFGGNAAGAIDPSERRLGIILKDKVDEFFRDYRPSRRKDWGR